jgi:hypothetical protein
MLQRCPDLSVRSFHYRSPADTYCTSTTQSLEMEPCPWFNHCRIPELRKLDLGPRHWYMSTAIACAAFLAANPTIEELNFRLLFTANVPFILGSLPSLKVLRASVHVAQFFLLDQTCKRPFEYLESIDMNDDRTLQAMEVMDRRYMKHLGIAALKSLPSMVRLSEFFQSLVSLSIEQCDSKDIVRQSLLSPRLCSESIWNSPIGLLFSLSSHNWKYSQVVSYGARLLRIPPNGGRH